MVSIVFIQGVHNLSVVDCPRSKSTAVFFVDSTQSETWWNVSLTLLNPCVANFAKHFKNKVKMTPSELRRNISNVKTLQVPANVFFEQRLFGLAAMKQTYLRKCRICASVFKVLSSPRHIPARAHSTHSCDNLRATSRSRVYWVFFLSYVSIYTPQYQVQHAYAHCKCSIARWCILVCQDKEYRIFCSIFFVSNVVQMRIPCSSENSVHIWKLPYSSSFPARYIDDWCWSCVVFWWSVCLVTFIALFEKNLIPNEKI